MTREEEIIKQGIFYTSQICPACISGDDPFNWDVRDLNRNKAFEAGAKWADEHPINDMWHTPDEEPQGEDWEILCEDANDDHWIAVPQCSYNWEKFVKSQSITHWAYIKDLLPKGGN